MSSSVAGSPHNLKFCSVNKVLMDRTLSFRRPHKSMDLPQRPSYSVSYSDMAPKLYLIVAGRFAIAPPSVQAPYIDTLNLKTWRAPEIGSNPTSLLLWAQSSYWSSSLLYRANRDRKKDRTTKSTRAELEWNAPLGIRIESCPIRVQALSHIDWAPEHSSGSPTACISGYHSYRTC